MKIGNLILKDTPLFLAPMEDVTYRSFRWMCKKFGADVVYTEFVSSEGLIRNVKKSKLKMALFDSERPAAIQIYGHNINSMVRAAQVAEEFHPDFIDLNFGCPVKKIIRNGAGAALLKDLPKMQKMAESIVRAVKTPVTAKTRLGWNENDRPVLEAALRLQDAGISALAVHGRTRDQMYYGTADWSLIGEVKNHPDINIPIIGNGDITSGKKAKYLLDKTGVDGLMIGRPAIGRPWIWGFDASGFMPCWPPMNAITLTWWKPPGCCSTWRSALPMKPASPSSLSISAAAWASLIIPMTRPWTSVPWEPTSRRCSMNLTSRMDTSPVFTWKAGAT